MSILNHMWFPLSYIVESANIKRYYLMYKLNCILIVENRYERHPRMNDSASREPGVIRKCICICMRTKVSKMLLLWSFSFVQCGRCHVSDFDFSV